MLQDHDADKLLDILYKLVGEAASPQFGDKLVSRGKEVSIQIWCKPKESDPRIRRHCWFPISLISIYIYM